MSEELEQALSILTTPGAEADQIQVCGAGPLSGRLGILYMWTPSSAYISGTKTGTLL